MQRNGLMGGPARMRWTSQRKRKGRQWMDVYHLLRSSRIGECQQDMYSGHVASTPAACSTLKLVKISFFKFQLPMVARRTNTLAIIVSIMILCEWIWWKQRDLMNFSFHFAISILLMWPNLKDSVPTWRSLRRLYLCTIVAGKWRRSCRKILETFAGSS